MTTGERTVGDWVVSTHIGSGSFAIVWKARHKLTGQESAIKEIALDKLNAKLRQSLESEVSILKRINHDNIVKLLEVFEEKSKLYLIMEYCAGGDLAHYIRAHKRVPEGVAQHFMQQLAAGLREMWAHHLVHRDLKPQNLLLAGPGPTSRLKIADFGFARNLQPQGLAETLCGSPLYMAPEILHFHKYDAKADLWSVGAILFELVAGRPPFNGANQFQLLRNIERGEARLPDVVASQLSLPCRQLIHALLRRNPVERISFEEFFRHPFLTGPAPAPPPPSPFGSLPLGRSISANSIPQQVLGFKQVQGPPSAQGPEGSAGGAGGAGPAGLGGGAGGPVPAPVVAPGQLSNQLKQRRSLDLDGVAQLAQQAQHAGQLPRPGEAAPGSLAAQLAGLASRAAQQQQQWPLHQNGGLYKLDNAWGQQREEQMPGHAGSLGRQAGGAQGFQLAGAGFGRPAPFTHGSAPPAAHPLLHPYLPGPHPLPALNPQPHASLQPPPQQQQQPLAAPATQPQPAAALEPAVQPPPRPASFAAAAGSAAAGRATGPSASADSLDDDYVLVDTVLSSRSQQQSSPVPPESPASRAGSLANSLHARPADEVFTVGPSEDGGAGAALDGGAALPHPSPWATAGETEEEAPRWQLLRRVAHAMELLAGPPRPQQQPEQSLSLCLASLQLLELALDALAATAAGGHAAAGQLDLGSADEQAAWHQQQQQLQQGAACERAEAKLGEDVARVLDAAHAAAALAQQDAAAAAGRREGAPEPPHAALPDPWELCYHLSLGLAKEAAVDELLGHQERSLQLYSKACCLLHFLCTEGPTLPLEPALQLTPQDRLRLQRYTAATSARWAACKAQLEAEHARVPA